MRLTFPVAINSFRASQSGASIRRIKVYFVLIFVGI
jgi:hypothetical protein